jgi:hypothetical protein
LWKLTRNTAKKKMNLMLGKKFCLHVHDTTALKYGSYYLDLFPRLLFLHAILFVLNDLSCGFVPLFSKYLFWSGEIPPLCVHALSSQKNNK